MDPTIIAAIISAAASIGSGALSGYGNRPQETGMQKKKQQLIDDLLASLDGNGKYSDLYAMDDAAFQKSFVDPAKARFTNQIAPQIQQSYIASGQQRSSGLDDQLLRAGVDLDQMLNEKYMQFQSNALDRKQNVMNNILGQGDGYNSGPSTMQNLATSGSAYLNSPAFADLLKMITSNQSNVPQPQSKGFAA